MLLLVGLGNPGTKYKNHRHNVGFMAADAIADAQGFGAGRNKFNGDLREGFLSAGEGSNGIREKAIILKPLTYMNESGQCVGEAARFYKIDPENIVVFYDELDLAPGKLRMKTGGGAAGHNGIRSIDAHVGNSFRRARIGIGHPGDKAKVTNHVLGDFSKIDQTWLDPMLQAIASQAGFLAQDDQRFATAVAQKLTPSRPEKKTKTASPAANGQSPTNAVNEKKSNGPFDALSRLISGKDDKG